MSLTDREKKQLKAMIDADDPLKWERLKLWCEDASAHDEAERARTFRVNWISKAHRGSPRASNEATIITTAKTTYVAGSWSNLKNSLPTSAPFFAGWLSRPVMARRENNFWRFAESQCELGL